MKKIFKWNNKDFEISNVNASIMNLNNEEVLRLERDLVTFPIDMKDLNSTVDEATFLKICDYSFEKGIIEVEILSRILDDAPSFARGFIGVAFRIDKDNTEYESIYLRPSNSRCNDQLRRNHTIQYYSYPHYKFDVLREKFNGEFETYADIGLNEWIKMKIEVKNNEARLFLNNSLYPVFIVNNLKGSSKIGSVGLWVEVGTEGYFKNLKITKE